MSDSDGDGGNFDEPVEPMNEDHEEDNMLFEDLEEAQHLKEQAGDANGGEENGERVPHEAEVLGLIEMRGEQDGNEEVLFDAAEGPMAAVQVEGERVANSVRVTRPWLSKYEKTRIIGTRATQLAMGAASTVECPDETDPLRIAEKELSEFRVPLIVRRYLPDGSFEDWTVAEMNPVNNRLN